jgi:hypothetical protein
VIGASLKSPFSPRRATPSLRPGLSFRYTRRRLVIRETIREMNKVAIGRVVLTNREHIIALEPLDKGPDGNASALSV